MTYRPTILDVGFRGLVNNASLETFQSTTLATEGRAIGTTLNGALGDFVPEMVGGIVDFFDNAAMLIVGYSDPFLLHLAQPFERPLNRMRICYGATQLTASGIGCRHIVVTNLQTTGSFTTQNVTINGTLHVVGGTTLSQLSTTHDTTIAGGLSVTGTSGATITHALTVNGALDLPSVINTKGAILVSTGTSLTQLLPGTNGQILVADSTTPTGLRWADP